MVPREAIQELHDSASGRGDAFYMDPNDGMLVMTAHHHRERGYCCGTGCRHCPYPPDEQEEAGRPEDAECWEVSPPAR